MFGKTSRLSVSEFQYITGSRHKDLILLRLYPLIMLNDETSWNIFKIQISTQIDKNNLQKKKMLQTIKAKNRNRKFNILFMQNNIIFFLIKCEPSGAKRSTMSFWNKQKWLTKVVSFDYLKD